MPIKTALISVSDKKGIVPFAKNLQKLGVEILSTGGTAKVLRKAKVKVKDVSAYTGFSEIMDGRVKTLHPKIHGGILALRDSKKHLKQAKKMGIKMIDLVVINLYPFQKTVKKKSVTEEEAVSQIDIGGPSMLRAAAKNFKFVTAVTDPSDYRKVLKEIKKSGEVTLETRKKLATKVFESIYLYDLAIVDYLRGNGKDKQSIELLDLHYEKVCNLRYGENPHQKAVFFRNPGNKDANVTNAKVLNGKQLSFNNILDGNAAIEFVKDFKRPTVVFIKHTNPCGASSSEKIDRAFELAHQVDEMSAFGCVIAMNRKLNSKIVDYINKKKLFIEIIAAPSYEKKALLRLKKRKNLRILELGRLRLDRKRRDIKKVAGGVLVQNADTFIVKRKNLKIVTKKKPTPDQLTAMMFARKVVKHVKSNSVVFAKVLKDGSSVATGIGAGQMSRVDSVWIAGKKGGKGVKGSAMASDAFFPFPDGVEQAHKVGISCIIQPGGSVRDKEVIAKADELGITMVFTGARSFKH